MNFQKTILHLGRPQVVTLANTKKNESECVPVCVRERERDGYDCCLRSREFGFDPSELPIEKITAKSLKKKKATLGKAQVDDTGNSGLPRMLVRVMR